MALSDTCLTNISNMIRRTSYQDLPPSSQTSFSPIKTPNSPLYSTLTNGDWIRPIQPLLQATPSTTYLQFRPRDTLNSLKTPNTTLNVNQLKKEWRQTYTPTSQANTNVSTPHFAHTSIRVIDPNSTNSDKNGQRPFPIHQKTSVTGAALKRCSIKQAHETLSSTMKNFNSATAFPSNKENTPTNYQSSSKQGLGKVCNNGKQPSQTTKKQKASDFLKTIKQWKEDRKQRERSVTPEKISKTQTDIKTLHWLRKANVDSNKENRKKERPIINTVTSIPDEMSRERSQTPVKVPPPAFLSNKSSNKSNYSQACLPLSHASTASSSTRQMGISDWKIGPKLGEGRFGNVFKAIHRGSGCIAALKKIPKQMIKESLMIDQLLLEIKIQNWLTHSNLVKVYGIFEDILHVYLLLEYLEGGTLYQELRRKGKLSESETVERVVELCQAVKHIHDRGVAHRDIKPENILISHEVCKLGDFGWATFCDERRNTYCGTTDYVAPEIIEGVGYDMAVDLWCVGVLTYELMAGKTPFYHISRQQTFKKIKNVSEQPLTFPDFFSPHAIDFISRLLKKQPEERMSMAMALNHPFLKQN